MQCSIIEFRFQEPKQAFSTDEAQRRSSHWPPDHCRVDSPPTRRADSRDPYTWPTRAAWSTCSASLFACFLQTKCWQSRCLRSPQSILTIGTCLTDSEPSVHPCPRVTITIMNTDSPGTDGVPFSMSGAVLDDLTLAKLLALRSYAVPLLAGQRHGPNEVLKKETCWPIEFEVS